MLGLPVYVFPDESTALEFGAGMRELLDNSQDHEVLHKFRALLGLTQLPFAYDAISNLPRRKAEIKALYNWIKQEWPNLATWLNTQFELNL